MIYDRVTNLIKYLPAYDSEIAAFLRKISPELPDGEYDIAGEKVFARVMSYDTSADIDSLNTEAHDRYTDIQSTITGAEGIGVFERDSLAVKTEYNAAKDVTLYVAGEQKIFLPVYSGYFAMLFPHEAHRPKSAVGGGGHVKKFVIKIDAGLFI